MAKSSPATSPQIGQPPFFPGRAFWAFARGKKRLLFVLEPPRNGLWRVICATGYAPWEGKQADQEWSLILHVTKDERAAGPVLHWPACAIAYIEGTMADAEHKCRSL